MRDFSVEVKSEYPQVSVGRFLYSPKKKKEVLNMLKRALLIAALLGFSVQSFAGILYVADNADNLRAIDTSTLAVSTVGPLGVNFTWSGLTYNPHTDTLFGVDGRSGQFNLYSIDRTTGTATAIGNHGVPELFGLAYDSTNDVLYASQLHSTDRLYSIDQTTGAATLIGSLSGSPGIGGMGYDSSRDQLIGWYDFGGDIYDINRSTGAATLITNGPNASDGGLAYDSELDLFWGVDITNNGTLFSLDPTAGYARTNHLTGLGGSPVGLAFVSSAVPEPASLILLGLGLLGFGAARSRKTAS